MYPYDEVPMETGLGYWLWSAEGVTIDAEGMPTAATDFAIDLLSGWNQIGHPFQFSVDWEDVLVYNPATGETVSIEDAHLNNWVFKFLYWYNPAIGNYEYAEAPDGQLDEWMGYWVKAMINCQLLVPATPM